jgi:hypothetical protein
VEVKFVLVKSPYCIACPHHELAPFCFFCSVAKVVINTEQIFKEKLLEVKRLGTEKLKENVEKLRNKKRKKETRRVLVSGLPEGTTENNVHIHFQKKKNGGGEIEKVELLGEGKAIVVFEESRGTFYWSAGRQNKRDCLSAYKMKQKPLKLVGIVIW